MKKFLPLGRVVIACVMLCLSALGVPAQAQAPKSEAQTYYLFVFSNPVAGREDEYVKWYAEQHQFDVVSVPGFMSAQRFVTAESQLRTVPETKPKYLIVYKIVTADLKAVYAEVNRRIQSGETKISPSFDIKTAVSYTYRAFRPEIQSKSAPAASAKPLNTYYQIVFGEAKDGRDAEFNAWYDATHAPDVLTVPGFRTAQRMVRNDVQLGTGTGSTYVALFSFVSSDLDATFAEFHRLAPGMKMSPAFDNDRAWGYTYRALGPAIDGDKVRADRAKH